MAKIVSIHSFRRGTGKSIMTANIAALLAAEGRRVIVLDTNLESPSLHILFHLNENEITHSLNQYLWGQCSIRETIHDVTHRLGAEVSGQVFFIPASTDINDIKRIIKEGYDAGILNYGCYELADKLDADIILIDTHAGLNAETLASLSIAHVLTIILRLDKQDYQGTGVMVDLARKIDMPPQRLVVANEVPASYNFDLVKTALEKTFDCEVVAVLPHSDKMMALASNHIFALTYPHHPLTEKLRHVANRLLA
ncbi:MAG: MinD/ParA family protein [Anaerolineales bacterium]|nr:MinD/ParA family protein [Anaerolineales bacterium]